MSGAGRVAFAGVFLIVVGVLNLIYGIGALDNANIFVNDTRFIFTNLNTLGVVGVIAGTLGAIGALLSIGGAFPWWSLAIFFLCVWIVYGILVYGDEEAAS